MSGELRQKDICAVLQGTPVADEDERKKKGSRTEGRKRRKHEQKGEKEGGRERRGRTNCQLFLLVVRHALLDAQKEMHGHEGETGGLEGGREGGLMRMG
jgi:hypothetical protein